ncbi:hypothetical protein SAMN02745664_12131 [Moraxella cuniculi DSM 21768]|uniref:SMI1-KNR4 cell-wall n=1 Tax=Moraxella cuniculi DSM 21768 TaxID=1122245 RepID=A0A1N7G1A3_9GAMM|nr:hypothetical protein [Moraxella cuniculi]OOS07810.1 hypothetical protein B0189_02020 [Moraxella cuniculi]SIS06347.1 hypothetical protein SAMN02745664_12131 [Moraxella cuniculi DSM 21768]
MFSDSFIEYLNENLGRIFLNEMKKYVQILENKGLNQSKNSDFIYFWSNYSDEIYGNEGYLMDFCMDIEDFETSETYRLRQSENLPSQYFSLMGQDNDDYLFYDMNTDNLYLVDGDNLKDFILNKVYVKKWDSFLIFIQEFLGYSE